MIFTIQLILAFFLAFIPPWSGCQATLAHQRGETIKAYWYVFLATLLVFLYVAIGMAFVHYNWELLQFFSKI